MNHAEIAKELRAMRSRSKRKLLDEAADTIEVLAADLKIAGEKAPCDVCRHSGTLCTEKVFDCDNCPRPCPCKACGSGGDGWEWRGVQRKEGAGMKK